MSAVTGNPALWCARTLLSMGAWGQAKMCKWGAVVLVGIVGWGCGSVRPASPDAVAADETTTRPAPGGAKESPVAPASPIAATPLPGFVVLTADSTLAIPLDAASPTFSFPGLAVGAPDNAYGHVAVDVIWAPPVDDEAFEAGEVFRLPYCAEENSGCSGLDPDGTAAALVQVDGRGHVGAVADWDGPDCDCVPVAGISTDPQPPLTPEMILTDPAYAEELEMMSLSLYAEEDYIAYCILGEVSPEDRTEFAFSSVLGGVLYETGMGHEGSCSGLNIYNADQRHTALRPGAAPREGVVPEGAACDFDSLGDGFAPEDMRYASVEGDNDGDCRYGDEACDGCDADEAVASMIVNGALVQVNGEISPAGGGCSCRSAASINTANCPSSFDTCGTAKAFPSVADTSAWWVETKEHAALLLRGGALEVRMAPGDKSVRVVDSPGEILGVEFHPDLRPMGALRPPTTVLTGAPEPDEADRDLRGTARAWGNRCFEHFKAGRLGAAEAACVQALRQGGTDPSRGAVTYTLGRVEEARGDRDRAAAYYRRSLSLRPGNDTVQERLDQLAAPPR